MKTILSIVLLIVFAVVANFLATIVVNLAGLPGALLSGTPGKRSIARFKFGSVIAALGQSYVYLAYAAFIVNWTMLAARREDVPFGFILWPVAFLAVLGPIWKNWIQGRIEAKEVMRETGFANPQVEGLQYTVLASIVAFLLFAFFPSVMKFGWTWVTYIR